MTHLALPQASSRKNYYVSLFSENGRELFYPFYGKDFESEKTAKEAAFRCFLKRNGDVGFYNRVELTENNGMQIADSNEPYQSKCAIVTLLASKQVPIGNPI